MKHAALIALCLSVGRFAEAADEKLATLHVEKIQCIACATTIKKALSDVRGVNTVDVDADKKVVVVRFDSTMTNAPDLAAATAKRGFPATIRKVEP